MIYLRCLILIFLIVIGSSALAIEYPPDIARIINHGYIRIAVNSDDNPPLLMHDKHGHLAGLDIDLAKDLARRMGVKARFVIAGVHYDDVTTAVAKQQADMGISQLSRTLRRALEVSFSKPYLQTKLFFLVNRLNISSDINETNFMQNFDDAHHTLAMIRGSGFEDYATEYFPHVKLILFRDLNTLALAVLHRKVTAAFIDNIDLLNLNYVHSEYAIYLCSLRLVNMIDTNGIAVNYKDSYLLQWINLYLENIQNDGFLAHLKQLYFEDTSWRLR